MYLPILVSCECLSEPLCHKVRTYKEYHSVCPSSELGLSQPLSRQRVIPSPQKQGGRGHTSLRVGGWGESQFRRGAYTVVLFICTYFVPCAVCYRLDKRTTDQKTKPNTFPSTLGSCSFTVYVTVEDIMHFTETG
jgi:hypothetical protein